MYTVPNIFFNKDTMSNNFIWKILTVAHMSLQHEALNSREAFRNHAYTMPLQHPSFRENIPVLEEHKPEASQYTLVYPYRPLDSPDSTLTPNPIYPFISRCPVILYIYTCLYAFTVRHTYVYIYIYTYFSIRLHNPKLLLSFRPRASGCCC